MPNSIRWYRLAGLGVRGDGKRRCRCVFTWCVAVVCGRKQPFGAAIGILDEIGEMASSTGVQRGMGWQSSGGKALVAAVISSAACQGPVTSSYGVGGTESGSAQSELLWVSSTAIPVTQGMTVPDETPTDVPLGSTATTGTEPPRDVQACANVGFFDFYRNARLITLDTPELVRLQIHIDYHTGAGCIAPDGHGTDLIVKLHLRASGGACFVDSAEVRAVDWGLREFLEPDATNDRKLRFDFAKFDVLREVDLTSARELAVPIHSAEHAVSLLVRRGGVLWYERTKATSLLHTNVDSQGEQSGCCWPSTSTYYREFGVYD